MRRLRPFFYGLSIFASLFFGTNVTAADCEPVYRSALEISPDHAGLQKALALILEAKKAAEFDHFGEVQPAWLANDTYVMRHSILTESDYPVLFSLLEEIQNQELPDSRSVNDLNASYLAQFIFQDNIENKYLSGAIPFTYDQIKTLYMGTLAPFIEIIEETMFADE